MDYTREINKLNDNIKIADTRLHQLWLQRHNNPNYESDFKVAIASYSEAHSAFDKFMSDHQKPAWIAYQDIMYVKLSSK